MYLLLPMLTQLAKPRHGDDVRASVLDGLTGAHCFLPEDTRVFQISSADLATIGHRDRRFTTTDENAQHWREVREIVLISRSNLATGLLH